MAEPRAFAPHTCGGSVFVVPDVPLLQTELLALLRRLGFSTLALCTDLRVCTLWRPLAAPGRGPRGVTHTTVSPKRVSTRQPTCRDWREKPCRKSCRFTVSWKAPCPEVPRHGDVPRTMERKRL